MQHRRRHHGRSEEVQAAKAAIERETLADAGAIVERLRSVEALKQVCLLCCFYILVVVLGGIVVVIVVTGAVVVVVVQHAVAILTIAASCGGWPHRDG